MNPFFEIHAPGIDSEELLKKVEESARSRGYDPAEIERIRELSFTPVSPASGRGFDPVLTSELLERPVSRPDFSSRKFRFLKLPLISWLASRFFELLVQIHTKLDENRVQAFYNVIHELIAVNYRYDRMLHRFNDVLAENLQLRNRLEEMRMLTEKGSSDIQVSEPVVTPDIAPDVRIKNERLLETLVPLFPRRGDAIVFCVDDEWGHFAFELRSLGFQKISVNAADLLQRIHLERVRGLSVAGFSAESALSSCPNDSQDLISLLNLTCGTGRPEVLISLSHKRLKPGGYLLLRMATDLSSGSVFKRHFGYTARRADVINFLKDQGLDLAVRESDSAVDPVRGSEESFDLILRKPEE